MDRMACVDLPTFPLQLLLRRRPDWQSCPVAVVDSDKPQGRILWANERARKFRILPGMRYAEGLSLAGGLRAAEVPTREINRAIVSLSRRLHDYTPGVEPSREDPGVFWLDASGLERLYDSLSGWAGQIRSALKHLGFKSSAVVGYSRFGTYALAKFRRNLLVLDKPAAEREAARRVPLDRLALEPETRDTLRKLGIRTAGQFMDLPSEGIAKRFGPEVHRLHRFVSGLLCLPLQPEQPRPPAVRRACLDHPETNVHRLMVVIERLVKPLLGELADRGHALTRIHVGLYFERLGQHVERVCPAAPTLDAAQLLDLIRLRLEAVRRLPDGVMEIALAADGVTAPQGQLQMFGRRPKRDLAAANQALARLRAEFGEDAVVCAKLRDGHMPEARFTWEKTGEVVSAKPHEVDGGTLVRRIYSRPRPLPSRPRHEPDGWMLRGLKQGPVVRVLGPYIVSGGWWQRTVHREYHFAETQKGELLWVYYDRARRRWFLQGRVE